MLILAPGEGNDRLLFEANNGRNTGFNVNQWRVETGEGNDRVNVNANNTDSSRGFVVTSFDTFTQEGNDRVEFEANNTGEDSTGFAIGFPGNDLSTEVGGPDLDWQVSTGVGNDRVAVEANNLGFSSGFDVREFSFLTGAGNDRVTIAAENEGNFTTGIAAGRGTINTGGDDDRIAIDASNTGFASTGLQVDYELNIVTDGLFETVAGDFESSDGRDRVDLKADNDGGTGFAFGGQVNPANTESVSFNGKLEIVTGGEDDRVNISANNTADMEQLVVGGLNAGFSLQEFVLETGADDDRVQIRSNNRGGLGFFVDDSVFIGTAEGDDDVYITVGRDNGFEFPIHNTFMDGGENDDRLRTNFYIPSFIHDNFEDFPVFDDENGN